MQYHIPGDTQGALIDCFTRQENQIKKAKLRFNDLHDVDIDCASVTISISRSTRHCVVLKYHDGGRHRSSHVKSLPSLIACQPQRPVLLVRLLVDRGASVDSSVDRRPCRVRESSTRRPKGKPRKPAESVDGLTDKGGITPPPNIRFAARPARRH